VAALQGLAPEAVIPTVSRVFDESEADALIEAKDAREMASELPPPDRSAEQSSVKCPEKYHGD
jgi:hypothetical protein